MPANLLIEPRIQQHVSLRGDLRKAWVIEVELQLGDRAPVRLEVAVTLQDLVLDSISDCPVLHSHQLVLLVDDVDVERIQKELQLLRIDQFIDTVHIHVESVQRTSTEIALLQHPLLVQRLAELLTEHVRVFAHQPDLNEVHQKDDERYEQDRGDEEKVDGEESREAVQGDLVIEIAGVYRCLCG